MFTGIVEEKGTLNHVKQQGKSLVVSVNAKTVLSDVSIGDSISVNGVCLTVTGFDAQSFSVDVMPETFKGTNLKDLSTHAEVNLERAMSATGRFGGHFVSGHVDAVATIVQTWRDENAKYIRIKTHLNDAKYLVEKGSVTVDGTSLTIFEVFDDGFVISLIPETQARTVLGPKVAGDTVNLEFDVLMKYMERLLTIKASPDQTSTLTKEKLAEFGF